MGLETLIVTLIGTAVVTMTLVFLPATIELIHPKDSGPRLIHDGIELVTIIPLTNIEEQQPFINPLTVKISGLLYSIANLEI
jgi:hypothetical protein